MLPIAVEQLIKDLACFVVDDLAVCHADLRERLRQGPSIKLSNLLFLAHEQQLVQATLGGSIRNSIEPE